MGSSSAPLSRDGVHDQPAAGNQHLFICQAHPFSQAHRFVSRFQPATPTIAEITISTSGAVAASTQRGGSESKLWPVWTRQAGIG